MEMEDTATASMESDEPTSIKDQVDEPTISEPSSENGQKKVDLEAPKLTTLDVDNGNGIGGVDDSYENDGVPRDDDMSIREDETQTMEQEAPSPGEIESVVDRDVEMQPVTEAQSPESLQERRENDQVKAIPTSDKDMEPEDDMSSQIDDLEEPESSAFSSLAESRPSLTGSVTASPSLEEIKPASLPVPVSTANDGIFDDAEEDETFDIAVFKKPKPEAAAAGVETLRPDLVDIILGSPARVGLHVTFEPPKVKKPTTKSKKPKLKKVLVTPRDKRATEKLLTGKVDLLKVLAREDCNFLAEQCWIFTLGQLQKVLEIPDNDKDSFRQEVIEKLSRSSLVCGHKSSENDKVNESSPAPMEVESPAKPSTDKEASGGDKGDVSEEHAHAAKQKLEEWKVAASKWMKENPDGKSEELDREQFPLDGPISVLIPTCYQNFFASINLKSMYDLMVLKKTETGIVIDMILIWRRKCQLVDMSHMSIAKHLLAVVNRIERIMEEVPGMNPKEKKWVGGVLNVLTGAAKDYVFDTLDDFSPQKFLDTLTTYLADGLAKWRESKGQPPLKGSGKVAMISAWKTMVRESIEIEEAEGKVILGYDFYQAAAPDDAAVQEKVRGNDTPDPIPKKQKTPPTPKTPKPKKKKKKTSDKSPQIESIQDETIQGNLHSVAFMEKLFPVEKLSLLKDVGIDTAEKLLSSAKGVESELVLRIIKDREANKAEGAIVQASSCVRLVYDWCSKVRANLDKTIDNVRPISKTSKRKPDRNLPPNKKQKKKKSQEVRTMIIRRKKLSDPFEILSAAPQEFLKSSGISNAKDFLSARTTDLAEDLIKWREKKSLSVLKGLGATASVSGWKALVRRTADEMGLVELSTLEPDGFAKPRAKPKEIKKPHKTSKLQFDRTIPVREITSHPFWNGMSRLKFAVRKAGGKDFIFKLSVRESILTSGKVAPFLTYLGHGTATMTKAKDSSPSPSMLSKAPSLPVLDPVLEDVPFQEQGSDFRSSFGVRLDDCGTIELGRYGIAKFANQDILSSLCDSIDSFISAENINGANQDTVNGTNQSNAKWKQSPFVQTTSSSNFKSFNVVYQQGVLGESNYYLHLPHLMEVGQAVELRVQPAPASSISEVLDAGMNPRNWMCERISSLELKDLNSLVDFVKQEIAPKILEKVDQAFPGSDPSTMKGSDIHDDGSNRAKAAVSRRRLHWVSLKLINALTQVNPNNADLDSRQGLLDFLWSQRVVERMSHDPSWDSGVLPPLVTEASNEITSELSSPEKNGIFGGTRPMWCPLAGRLFSSTLDRVALFAIDQESDVLKEIRPSILVAVTEVQTIAAKTLLPSANKEAFSDLGITYRMSQPHGSSLFPSVDQVLGPYIQSSSAGAMEVCSEQNVVSEDVDVTRKDLLATKVLRDQANKRYYFSMCTVEQIKALDGQIDQKWYIENQVLAVVESVIASAAAVATRIGGEALSNAVDSIYTIASDNSVGIKVNSGNRLSDRELGKIPKSFKLPISSAQSSLTSNVEPSALPIFLKLVWPYLVFCGWKMDVGESPAEVNFISPAARKRKGNQYQYKQLHQSRAKQRDYLSRQTSDLGLGYIPKQAKRLFIKASAENANENGPELSVASILEKVQVEIQSNFNEAEQECRLMIEAVFKIVRETFDTLAEKLLYEQEKAKLEGLQSQRPSDVLDASYLMRLLLVMPSMLNQSGLSAQQVGTATGVITELIDCISRNYHLYLPSSCHIPKEFYQSEPSFTTSIVKRTRLALSPSDSTAADTEMDELKDILLPSDRGTLTDFIQFILDQVVATRARAEDVVKKNRRIPMGYIGLCCRHCLGSDGEGKYFFSSLESLATTSTVMEKHLTKCTKTPKTVKDEMIRCRSLHAEQRQNLAQGNQAAFYNRLWKRLRSSKNQGGFATDLVVNLSPVGSSEGNHSSGEGNGAETTTDNVNGFQSHVALLDFVRTKGPWKDDKQLKGCLQSYYECLEYGGSIYGTNAMPKNFSSEWLLATCTMKD